MAEGIYNDPKWVGKKFNRLTVIGIEQKTSVRGWSTQWYWRVKCDCGCEKTMLPFYVVNGRNVSCGCYRKHRPATAKTHGESNTRLYKIWDSMNDRCKSNSRSKHYGDRGIKVCGEWKNYENFASWAKENGYEQGLSIDRIDVNGDYEPSNCRWATSTVQARNKTNTKYVVYEGKKMCFSEACELAGMSQSIVSNRMRKNHWSFENAISIPLNATRSMKRKDRPGNRNKV